MGNCCGKKDKDINNLDLGDGGGVTLQPSY